MAAVIPAVTKLSARVIRILGCNPGLMTLQGTNTYLLGTGKSRILVDTGADDVPQYITHLRHVLKHENCTLEHVVITHWHADHLGGLPHVLGSLHERRHDTAIASGPCQVWKHPGVAGGEGREESSPKTVALADGQTLSVDGATVHVHYTPGHSDDHVVLLLEEENALFSGDCVLGEGTTVFEDLYDYMNSLQKILKLNPDVIYPGHGNVIQEPLNKIQFYIDHRNERERQIIDVLQRRKEILSCEEIVKDIYVDTPSRLLPAAAVNVRHHLEKLEKEKRIIRHNDNWKCSL